MKITGGSLKVKTMLTGGQAEEAWEEKVNQIRIYSGEKYELARKRRRRGLHRYRTDPDASGRGA